MDTLDYGAASAVGFQLLMLRAGKHELLVCAGCGRLRGVGTAAGITRAAKCHDEGAGGDQDADGGPERADVVGPQWFCR
jgi:hypothetical protein